MSPSDRAPALALRVSSHQREARVRTEDGDRPRLRLLVTKGQLGVELDAPFELGPLRIDELALSFPHVKFPVELSGGVDTFRNRRGQLERMRITLSGPAAQRWAAPRLQKALAMPIVHHTIAPIEGGWLVGAATERGALAFDVVVAPLDGDLRLLPTHARAVGLGEPAQALAVRALAALVHPLGKYAGSALILERGPMELARAMLPLAGMRAPAARAMAWSSLEHDLDGSILVAARQEAPFAPPPGVVSAVELAALVADAERYLLAGDFDAARRGYLVALTRAPRHVEIGRRLAELDTAVGGRAEAALGTLAEVISPTDAGPLGARLLREIGDVVGSQTAWRRAALSEPFGPLAALCWMELGRLSQGDTVERALDEAIARAPVLTEPRWCRFEEHVRRGRIDEARADVEHLEAQADGSQARLDVLQRAAQFLLSERAVREASELFERALRYAPAHVGSIAGLAGALSLLGHKRRALELLSRAAALVEKTREPAPRVTLDYARALAEVADDRPAAIAHVSGIEHMTSACYEARLLEARWRAELGDVAGASASLNRFADALETSMEALVASEDHAHRLWSGPEALFPTRVDARRALATLAEEGARIHELDREDPHAARRLLELAMRLAPRVPSIRAAYKRVARSTPAAPTPDVPATTPEVSPSARPAVFRATPETQRASSAPVAEARPSDTMDEDGMAEAVMAARAEILTQQVRANPSDEAAVSELIDVLERLDRHHELLALLSARIDEAPEDQRAGLTERRRRVLQRMIDAARADGRADEAQLYELMLQQD